VPMAALSKTPLTAPPLLIPEVLLLPDLPIMGISV